MVTQFRDSTGEENTTVFPDTRVYRLLNRAQRKVNLAIGYYWRDVTSVTLVAGTQEYSLPSDFQDIVFIEHNGNMLKKGDYEEWLDDGDWRNKKDLPLEYAIYAGKLIFRPKPNAAAVGLSATPTIRYIACPPDVDGSNDISGLLTPHHDLIPERAVILHESSWPEGPLSAWRIANFRAEHNEGLQAAADLYRQRALLR